MHPLLRLCRDVLADPSSTAAVKTVAGTALLAAYDEDIPVPTDYARAVWSWLRTTTTYHGTERIGAVPDEAVRAEAVNILMNPNSGNDERWLAARVLAGSGHARHIDDNVVMALVEGAVTGEQCGHVYNVLSAVHRARGVPNEILVSIRDRWGVGPIEMKEAAVRVGIELLDLDLGWIARVVMDPEPDVRVFIASQLEVEVDPNPAVLELLHQRRGVETAPDARAAIHRAVAAHEEIENERARRRRRRSLRT